MSLSEHLKKEELRRLEIAWHGLTPLQRKLIRWRVTLATLPSRLLQTFSQYKQRQHSAWYPAHWL